uniref:Uncharacterized protein n=1 Tax=Arundo donax TaxID=35708 RepID=A0A0A8XNQ6_ARUDO
MLKVLIDYPGVIQSIKPTLPDSLTTLPL